MNALCSVFAAIGAIISGITAFAMYCLLIVAGKHSRIEEEKELKNKGTI